MTIIQKLDKSPDIVFKKLSNSFELSVLHLQCDFLMTLKAFKRDRLLATHRVFSILRNTNATDLVEEIVDNRNKGAVGVQFDECQVKEIAVADELKRSLTFHRLDR